jgi:WD40 repeat protein
MSDPIASMDTAEENMTSAAGGHRRRSTFFKSDTPLPISKTSSGGGNKAEESELISIADDLGDADDPSLDKSLPRRRRSIFEVDPEDLIEVGPPSPVRLSRATTTEANKMFSRNKGNSPLLENARKTIERSELGKIELQRERSATGSAFGDRNDSNRSNRSAGSESPFGSPMQSSPMLTRVNTTDSGGIGTNVIVMETYGVTAQESDPMDLTYESSIDLQSVDMGVSKPSYFSSLLSSFSNSVGVTITPTISPAITSHKSASMSTTSGSGKIHELSSIKIKRSNDSNESGPQTIPTYGKAAAEVYEELLLLDKTGKVRKGSMVTSIDTGNNWLVTGSENGIVELIDMKRGQQVAAVTHKEPIVVVKCLDKASGFVSACRGGVVKVWKMPKPQAKDEAPPEPKPKSSWFSVPRMSAVSPQDKRIAVIKGHSNPITAMVSEGGFDDSDQAYWQIASGDTTGEVSVYRGSTKGIEFNSAEMRKEGKSKRAKLSGVGAVSCLAMMASARTGKKRSGADSTAASDFVAVGTNNGAFALLDISTGHWTFRQAEAHGGRVNCVEPINGREILSASNDRTVKLWDVRKK